jgi:phosphoribosylformylglycinamidine cyclo-ligase
VQGARPLFFLDYVAMGKLEPAVLAAVVEGIARGCREAGCALLGGETAEMPGFYASGEYDVAGFIVGIVDRDRILDGSRLRAGDLLLGLPSAGLHTNGFSLARKILFERAGLRADSRVEGLEGSVADLLLAEHRSYLPVLREILDADLVEGLAHVTGGGLTDNLPRILPEGAGARIDRTAWPVPPLFRYLERAGGVAEREMYRTFNMGIGMVAAVRPENVEEVERRLDSSGERHWRIGAVVAGDGTVAYV